MCWYLEDFGEFGLYFSQCFSQDVSIDSCKLRGVSEINSEFMVEVVCLLNSWIYVFNQKIEFV